MKIKAPSKNSTIYRVVSWLSNNMLGEDYIPKNICQLFWQSILWFVGLLNVTTAVLVPVTIALGDEGHFVQYALDSIVLSFGSFVGLMVLGFISLVFIILTSWVFWSMVLTYLIMCLLHYKLQDLSWKVNGEKYYADEADHFMFRGCIVIFFVCHKVYKVVSKINCDDIK